jgi:hypothetical protein
MKRSEFPYRGPRFREDLAVFFRTGQVVVFRTNLARLIYAEMKETG